MREYQEEDISQAGNIFSARWEESRVRDIVDGGVVTASCCIKNCYTPLTVRPRKGRGVGWGREVCSVIRENLI